MSESDGGPGRREVAYRMFAAEYDDADFEFSESDEERAPNYVITPTGARVNRLFVVGVLTEVEQVSDDVLRARVVDPTGAFVCYAGQYQPDEQAFLERADPPMYVAVTGKARTFRPDDADVIYTSLRPEAINAVDVETRDRWTLQAAQQTVDRVRTAAGALALEHRGEALEAVLLANDVEEGFAAGIPHAFEHYGTTAGYLASLGEVALDAARLVADELDEVDAATLPPDADVERDLPVTARQFEVPDGLAATLDGQAAAGEHDAGQQDAGSPAAEDAEPSADVDPDPTTEPEASTDAAPATDTGAAADTTEPESASATAEADPDVTTAEGAAEVATGDPGSESVSEESETAAGGSADDHEGPASASTGPAGASDAGDDGSPEAGSGDDAEVGEFEAGEFDLDEEEREEIEAEYGTDFQSGTEVDEPGEADIETPDPEATGAAEPDMEAEPGVEADPGGEGEARAETEPDPGAAGAAAADPGSVADAESGADAAPDAGADAAEAAEPADVDLEDLAVEVMGDLDDGGGAARSEVVAAVVDRTGADEAAVEDAIQDALMDGRCFEPDDETLQAI